VYVISAPEEVYPEYLEVTDLRGKTAYTPSENGILVSNRISEKTGLKTGDAMQVCDEDYQPHTVTAGSVCRNYLGRNLYFSPEDYRSVFGEEPENNTFLVRVEHSARDTLREELKGKFPGLDLEYTDEIPTTLSGLKSTYNVIVYLMTALSILMPVFVLLNLVNIFVSRRKNEVIIMAVNGFSWAEQRGYLLKETVATTVSGLVLGIVGGYALTAFLVRIVESGDSMFVRSFNPKAWLFAAVVESVFALIINAISYRRVKKLKLTDIAK
jgi:putative ABC transport system permease protein